VTFCRSCGLAVEPTAAVQSCRCGTPGASWAPGTPTPEPTFRPGDRVLYSPYSPPGSVVGDIPVLVHYVGRAMRAGYSVISDTGDADNTRVVLTKNLKGTQ
jgi:hypothetical protein